MMAESKTPSVTTKASAPASTATSPYPRYSPGLTLNMAYFRSAPGIVKLIEIALAILCMACTAPAWSSGTHWFLFVVVTAFVATVLWCFIYLLSLREAVNLPIDWLLTELILNAVFVVLLVIACIVQFTSTVTKPRPPDRLKPFYMLAAVFGLLNAFVYTVGCFLLYRDWQDTHPVSSFAQGPGKV